MKEKKYEEVGRNYRFFLSWRHALLAGIFVIAYSVIFLTIEVYKQIPLLACCIPLLCSPVGVLFWMIDLKTSKLYYTAIESGKNLEGADGGIYSEISKIAKSPRKDSEILKTEKSTEEDREIFSHSSVLNIIFGGTSVLLLVSTIFILFFAIIKTAILIIATIKTFLP